MEGPRGERRIQQPNGLTSRLPPRAQLTAPGASQPRATCWPSVGNFVATNGESGGATDNEARALLSEEEGRLRVLSYDDLLMTYRRARASTRRGRSGITYQLETETFFDDTANRNLRVVISIDDGTARKALKPMTIDFIVAPDGSAVGE